MQKAPYIGFDFETGGFSCEKNPITEIAMIAIDGNTLKEIERIEFFVKPYDDLFISPDALKATGIKMTDVNKGVDKKEAVKRMKEFAKRVSKTKAVQHRPILFAHNSKFDSGFLEYIFESCNDDYKNHFNPVLQCTQIMAKMFIGSDTEKLTLGAVCEKLGVTLEGAHRAMNDTEAMTEVFRRLVLKMRGGVAPETTLTAKVKVKSRIKFQF